MNLRLIAYRVLKKVENGAFLQRELNSLEGLDERDVMFVANLTKGVLRSKLKLQHILKKHSNRNINEIDTDTLFFLLIGLYQLSMMNSVPGYAAVDETVEAMKSHGLYKSSGFVNGVLRSFIKGKHQPIDYKDDMERLSIEYSCPRWLVERISDNYQFEIVEEILKATQEEPPITIFVNKIKTGRDSLKTKLAREGIEVQEVPFFDDMLSVVRGRLTQTQAFKDGLFYIQDPASRLVAKVVSLLPGVGESIVLDSAAAPGGKSINMLAGGLRVISADLSVPKLIVMKENFERMELPLYGLVSMDASKPLPFRQKFKTVLLDAPCSAIGRIRRTPEIKYRLKPEDFEFLSKRQLGILSNLSDYVEDGGYLVYATCSMDRQENEGVIENFLMKDKSFNLADPREFLTQELTHFISGQGFIKTDYSAGKMDIFFIAVMRKRIL